MNRIFRRLLLGAVCVAATGTASAQFFGHCQDGTPVELQRSIDGHDEHMARLHNKLVTGWYFQGKLSDRPPSLPLATIQKWLGALAPRRPVLLFHAHDANTGRFCTWLVSSERIEATEVQTLDRADALSGLRGGALATLGLTSRSMPVRKSEMGKMQFEQQMAALDRELAVLTQPPPQVRLDDVTRRLLPGSVAKVMASDRFDTLVVMPILDLGVVPYAALPIDERRQLVDVVAVTIAPGFFVFRQPPRKAPRQFAGGLVVGNPYRDDPDWHLAPLPGADAEARAVAAITNTPPLLGPQASKAQMLQRMQAQPAPPLIYVAAHGVADDRDPLDGGFLALSDGRWSGGQLVKEAPRSAARPLVVLSACQTGLGKTFEVGTIGIARAWHEVGASSVVMSLWLIGDMPTRHLMTSFMQKAQTQPPDEALRQAMSERRAKDPRIATWASFAVFGAPQL
jgi:CHAT domain-containing protein